MDFKNMEVCSIYCNICVPYNNTRTLRHKMSKIIKRTLPVTVDIKHLSRNSV